MSALLASSQTLEDGGSAGYIALLIVVVIGVVTFFLIRNMGGRLDRLPKSFDQQGEQRGERRPPEDGPAA